MKMLELEQHRQEQLHALRMDAWMTIIKGIRPPELEPFRRGYCFTCHHEFDNLIEVQRFGRDAQMCFECALQEGHVEYREQGGMDSQLRQQQQLWYTRAAQHSEAEDNDDDIESLPRHPEARGSGG